MELILLAADFKRRQITDETVLDEKPPVNNCVVKILRTNRIKIILNLYKPVKLVKINISGPFFNFFDEISHLKNHFQYF